jgi:hypothetical protein
METTEIILDEVRALRAEFADWKQDSGERVTTLETQMKPLLDNGQPGRITQVERKVEGHSRVLWAGHGFIAALNAIAWALIHFKVL